MVSFGGGSHRSPTANFERPFTLQTRLRSVRNFAKTRFRRFRTFHCSTPKNFVRRTFWIIFFFSLIWRDFGGATAERTSKLASSSNFALDGLIHRSVCKKNLGFDELVRSLKIFHPDCGSPFCRWNEILSLRSPPPWKKSDKIEISNEICKWRLPAKDHTLLLLRDWRIELARPGWLDRTGRLAA